ncbi:NAD-dependent epimerase/dehydratase family protein [Comamonadaceae bacterium M7527]|nr:NAD-dependent epimerase/dehydratase family protein [Comamonadaceae bacterium M7527]
MTVLITGASGFIGRHLIAELLRNAVKVRVVYRHGTEDKLPVGDVEVRYLSGPGTAAIDWMDAVEHCSAVIHLAARAHVLHDRDEDPVLAFRLANVDFARACGEAAACAGVQRFIFMSSVGVHGGTSDGQPIHEGSAIKPHTQYACSKAEAEQALNSVAIRTGMKLTVIRPPLVYGPYAPGNFGTLIRAIASRLPLPLGSVTSNRRSFVAIDNLIDLIVTCLSHPAAENQTFLVSDGEDISTADLLQRLGLIMGRPARLIPVPVGWLAFGSKLLGKREMFQSLCGTLQLDIDKTSTLLNWKPPVSVDEGLRRAVQRGI